MTSDRLTEPVPAAPTERRWGDGIAVEHLDGVPFRMYTSGRVGSNILPTYAAPMGIAPYVVQGARVLTFDELQTSSP